jgi:hypothetical protein
MSNQYSINSDLNVTGTITSGSLSYTKTTYSAVQSVSISIDLTTYQMVEIILGQYYTGTNNVNVSLAYNGSSSFSEYCSIYVKNGAPTTTPRLFA